MRFQPDPGQIRWRLHLNSPPESVHQALATGTGRARFWAESAEEFDGAIQFEFPNGYSWTGKILQNIYPSVFQVEYIGGTITTFELDPDGQGGTLLTLTDRGGDPGHRQEVIAGWVSVLLTLKAAVDHGIDLRNHDPGRTWDQGFVEN